MPKKHSHSSKKRVPYGAPTSGEQMQANNEAILQQITKLESKLEEKGVNDTLSELRFEIDMMRTTVNEEEDEDDVSFVQSDYYFNSVVEYPRAACCKEVNIGFISKEFTQQIKKNLSQVKAFLSINLLVQYSIMIILLFITSKTGDVKPDDYVTSDSTEIIIDQSYVLAFYSPVFILLTLGLVLRVGSLYFLTSSNLKRYAFQAFGVHMSSWLISLIILLFSMGAILMVFIMALFTGGAPSFIALPLLLLWTLQRPIHQQVDFAIHLCAAHSSRSFVSRLFLNSFPAFFAFYPAPLPRISPRARIQIYLSYMDEQETSEHASLMGGQEHEQQEQQEQEEQV